MTPSDIVEAKRLLDKLEDTKRIREKIQALSICEISVTDGTQRFALVGGGTGTLTSFVPSKDCLDYLTEAFKGFYDKRLAEVTKALSDMNVDV